MNCADFKAHLAAYQDGELERAEGDALRAHLRACSSCRSTLAEMDRLWEVLGVTETVEPPVNFVARVREKTLDRIALNTQYSRRKVWAVGAAAAVVLCAFGCLAFLTGSKDDGEVITAVPRVFAPPSPAELEVALLKDVSENPEIMDILRSLDAFRDGELDEELIRNVNLLEDLETLPGDPEFSGGVTLDEAAILLELDGDSWDD